MELNIYNKNHMKIPDYSVDLNGNTCARVRNYRKQEIVADKNVELDLACLDQNLGLYDLI